MHLNVEDKWTPAGSLALLPNLQLMPPTTRSVYIVSILIHRKVASLAKECHFNNRN